MPTKKNIFVFGDSITYGEWDASSGWASRLREYYDSLIITKPLPRDTVITYNLGIPSDTSSGVVKRLTEETQARLSPNTGITDIQFVIAVGTNDSRWIIDENKRGVDELQFKANLQVITAAAKSFSNDIVFIGLLPCVETNIQATAKALQWDIYDNQSIKRYNEIIKQHCLDVDLKFVDLYPLFENNETESLFDDGLHPNSRGHSLIFDAIVKHL